jgi:hypothetical protein
MEKLEQAPTRQDFAKGYPNIGFYRTQHHEALEQWAIKAEAKIKELEHYRDTTLGLYETAIIRKKMKKTFSLTNRDISENYRDYKFYLMLSDFRGAFAYWLISQESEIDLDIKKPLDAFTKYLKQKYFKSGTVKEFTYDQLHNLISEDIFIAIPEVMELNEMKPNFYDLGALARNVFFMICREKITQLF